MKVVLSVVTYVVCLALVCLGIYLGVWIFRGLKWGFAFIWGFINKGYDSLATEVEAATLGLFSLSNPELFEFVVLGALLVITWPWRGEE